MNTKHVIAKAGSQAALAELLGITAAAVSQWGATVPLLRQYQLKTLRPWWFRKPRK